MGFRRGLALAAGQLALIAAGAVTVIAWRAGLYANVALLALLSLWIAAETVGRVIAAGDRPRATIPPPRQPPNAGKWRAFVDQSPAPLIALHADGTLRVVNRAARTLFQTDDRVVDPPTALINGLQTSDGGEQRSLTLPTPSGTRTFALQATDVTDEAGPLRLGVLVDIQAEVHAAEAKALRDLLAVLSHEIMNSLTPVASLAETAAEYLEGETSPSALAAREALAVLSRRASGLSRFVEGYRTLARLPPPALRRTALAPLLADIGQVFNSGWGPRGVRLVCEAPAADLTLDLDPDLITQALLNLLTNAAEAAGGSGANAEVHLTARALGGRTEILIEDNGPGVPAELTETLFQPFVTTKPHGAGVGLNLARQIALSHGGDLILLPQIPGRGARFQLVL